MVRKDSTKIEGGGIDNYNSVNRASCDVVPLDNDLELIKRISSGGQDENIAKPVKNTEIDDLPISSAQPQES